MEMEVTKMKGLLIVMGMEELKMKRMVVMLIEW